MLTGCASSPNLNNYDAGAEGATLIFELNQETLIIRDPYKPLNYSILMVNGGAVGGVVAALTEIELRKREQQKIKPVLAGLNKLALNQNFKSQLASTIYNIERLAIVKHIDKNLADQKSLKIGSHVTLIELSYFLTADLESLIMDARVSVKKVKRFRGSMKKRFPKYEAIYDNRYRYVSETVKPNEKDPAEIKLALDRVEEGFKEEMAKIEDIDDIRIRKASRRELLHSKNQKRSILRKAYTNEEKESQLVSYWSKNNSARTIEVLNQGIKELQKMVKADLSFIMDPTQKLLLAPYQRIENNYWLIAESEGRVIAQKKSRRRPDDIHGNLCSFIRLQGSERCT